MDATELDMMQDSYGKAKFLLNQGKSPFPAALFSEILRAVFERDGADRGRHGCLSPKGPPDFKPMQLEVGSTPFKMLQLRHILTLHFGEQRTLFSIHGERLPPFVRRMEPHAHHGLQARAGEQEGFFWLREVHMQRMQSYQQPEEGGHGLPRTQRSAVYQSLAAGWALTKKMAWRCNTVRWWQAEVHPLLYANSS